VHVHERGDKRLDAVLDFVAFTARPMPLLTLLDEAPRRIAVILGADVCSLYLLEGDQSELVMRGNVGFTNGAIGQVRLGVGQGITGQAVEYMRPITTSTAEEHGAYKHFAELGDQIVGAVRAYVDEVQAGTFPAPEHAYKPNDPSRSVAATNSAGVPDADKSSPRLRAVK